MSMSLSDMFGQCLIEHTSFLPGQASSIFAFDLKCEDTLSLNSKFYN